MYTVNLIFGGLMSLLAALILIGCGTNKEDTGATTLPADNAPQEVDSGTPYFAVDTSGYDTGFNQGRVRSLDIVHTGEMSLSPLSGPYTTLYGTMHVLEIIDGREEPPWCNVTFSLTGYASDVKCPTCEYAFDVEFYHLEEEPDEDEEPQQQPDMMDEPIEAATLGDCLSPDLPGHQEVRRLGYSPVDNTIYFDYFNSGIWIPWFEAQQIHDEVSFTWEANLGFFGFED